MTAAATTSPDCLERVAFRLSTAVLEKCMLRLHETLHFVPCSQAQSAQKFFYKWNEGEGKCETGAPDDTEGLGDEGGENLFVKGGRHHIKLPFRFSHIHFSVQKSLGWVLP